MKHNRSFYAPQSLDEARSVLAETPDTVLVAGGQWLVPMLSSGHVDAQTIVALDRIAELRGIDQNSSVISIGAGETHRTIAQSALLSEQAPVITEIAGQIADPATRNRGTLGGALGSDQGRTDYAGLLLASNGQFHSSRRAWSAEVFYASPDGSNFQPDEILISVSLEPPRWGVFEKIPHPAANHAEAAIFMSQTQTNNWRVVAMGQGLRPQRLEPLETQLDSGVKGHDLIWPETPDLADPFLLSRLRSLFLRGLNRAPV